MRRTPPHALLALMLVVAAGCVESPTAGEAPGAADQLTVQPQLAVGLPVHARLAWTSGRAPGDLWVASRGGGRRTNVTGGQLFAVAHPRWSPDGTKLVMQGVGPWSGGIVALVSRIFVADADGRNLTILMPPDLLDSYDPEWSPDGSRIAFVKKSDFDNNAHSAQIHVIDADGTDLRRITDLPNVRYPVWSPQGARIAFSSYAAGWELHVVNPDGSDVTNLTNDPALSYDPPRWSPDGQRIALDRDSDIWVVNADGTGLANLTPSPATWDRAPEWSPDGSRIAFVSSGVGGFQIRAVNPDGSGLAVLADAPRDVSLGGWSPDSGHLTYSAGGDIHMVSADGSRITVLSDEPAQESSPVWSPVCAGRGGPPGTSACGPVPGR